MSAKRVTLTFHGGAGGVTGSNFLLAADGTQILIDCGLFQGDASADERNRKPFPYDPKKIAALLVTHAHLDHIGRIPLLAHSGFSGTVYSTPATKDLAEVMFQDSLSLLKEEAKRRGSEPLYTEEDVSRTLALWKTVPYGQGTLLSGGFSFTFRDAGHILGSSMAEILYAGKKIVFSGDLGNSPSPLLSDTEEITDADYLVIESVYGDRNHEHRQERWGRLEDALEDAIRWGGTLLIPVFSIERTQTLLFEMNALIEDGKIPNVPVFIDSPLAYRITEVYRKRIAELNSGVQERMRAGDNIFEFPKLKFTHTPEESRAIEKIGGPKIIIAGSGMSHGGRILRHEARCLPDPKSTLLIIGYQVPGSLGRALQDGAKNAVVSGQKVSVRARVVTLSGYSAHKDSEGLFAFVEHTADTLKKVFVVMGEPKSSLFLVQRIRDYLGIDARAPQNGESVELEF
ncbi:hypothetical protein A2761_01175 [Candidatus Kaiserbacteria bacterium RIFCSPHIGHO2_01_FULL_51_33]|uniref:MBL fold hydrolase n=1 Tax=Candidatus Kaiserbacteria bacterium RIFCSPLOWO2_01_FULL_51_21 TaxID=1798508 RepID=A0A1F6ECG5_9BACT|nr:MAG: hypothetical protein A2761_01175 [Candidatus Kaiserbacteria bacterium RIFCSPHIGHO2_01_FULL_51_33]OGG71373.1 MAG: hypothetical protein A3A35_01330 [Candidatus Kaiserbacteria bacterium RIFCSPLOWO2_01_FULL_51_21]